MICADELKNIVYKDLTEAARKTMRKIVDHLESVENPPETIQQKLLGLRWNCAWSAANSKYGYLKKPLKDGYVPKGEQFLSSFHQDIQAEDCRIR